MPFRAGIEIHRIYGDRIAGPAAAVLRYRTCASAPWHVHRSFEHVVMPDGSQENERGVYPADGLAINPPGSCRSVRRGCVALLIWEQPMRLIAPEAQADAPPSHGVLRGRPLCRPIAPIGADHLRTRRRVTTPWLMRRSIAWRDAGAVERGGLENRCTRERTVGSNPTPSAKTPSGDTVSAQ